MEPSTLTNTGSVNVKTGELNYWTKYLAAAEPCHFPIRNDGLEGPNKLDRLPVNVGVLSELQEFCQSYDISLMTLFQLSWAMVLRCYTRTDAISFGYQVDGIDYNEHLKGGFMLPFALNLGTEMTIAQILKNVHADLARGIEHRHQWSENPGAVLFNTSLAFRASSAKNNPFSQEIGVSETLQLKNRSYQHSSETDKYADCNLTSG